MKMLWLKFFFLTTIFQINLIFFPGCDNECDNSTKLETILTTKKNGYWLDKISDYEIKIKINQMKLKIKINQIKFPKYWISYLRTLAQASNI